MKPPFEQVVEIHGATVLRVCRAVLGPRPESEDAWSETFLAALRAYPGLPPDANVQAWLVTIAHRKALDAVRAAGRRAVPVADVPERHSTIGLVRDRDDALWRALAALPERQRLTVAYHHVAGLPFREVAEILGGTPEAARRASSDGIRALRSALGGARPAPAAPAPLTAKGTR
ncbi:MAG: sigma-70 family RNA polymerase sigma factor [Arthrobacter sp.]|uniref:RNA polymerase sigma factor n=1 Tax=Arthrobacter sp. TaxID=1667 RepID=UPI00348D5AA5